MASGTRNWKFVIWKESAPDDLIQRLANSFLKVNMILHDKDHHKDGTPVKPHYDGVIMLDGPQPYDKMMKIMKDIAGAGINTIQECIQTSGALKYICHLGNVEYYDDGEKYQYDTKDVISLNGADYLRDIIRYQDADTYDEEIIRFIEKSDILMYKDLVVYAKYLMPEWYKSVSTRTLFWKAYVQSRQYKKEHAVKSVIDDVIKEIINGD